MEAGVFGCVPMVSNFDGISKIIKHGYNGFLMNSITRNTIIKIFKKFLRINLIKRNVQIIFLKNHIASLMKNI